MGRPRLGIDLGGTKIEGIRLEADGSISERRRVPTPAGDYAATIDAIADVVAALEQEGESLRVGIGTPGAISPATGLIKNANSTALNGHPLKEDLEARLGREVRLANDANCFALSEAVDGAAKEGRIVFGVIMGTGVGGGLVVDRRTVIGANAIAGEWGHNPLVCDSVEGLDAPACYCGRHGCVESWLSGPAFARGHQARGGAEQDGKAIAAAAATGDTLAQESLELHARRLASALAMVINIFDPHVIVLGGGLSNIDFWYRRVPEIWGDRIFSDHVATKLVAPHHGDAGGTRGAAWLWGAE